MSHDATRRIKKRSRRGLRRALILLLKTKIPDVERS